MTDLLGYARRRRVRFDPDQPHQLALIPGDQCPACGHTTDRETTHQDALLTHGGYGATRTTTWRRCPCGWALQVDVTETRPPRKDQP